MSYLSGFPRAIVPGGVEMDLDAVATALPNLRLDPETLGEIRQALNSGKEVITHTDPVSVPGWQGAGYVITDMETGAGAWKIGGGLNGAKLIIGGLVIMMLAFSVLPYLAISGIELTFFARALVVATSLIFAGISLINGDTFMCNVYLTTALAAVGVMTSLLIPSSAPQAVHILASIFGMGGTAGAVGFGKICS